MMDNTRLNFSGTCLEIEGTRSPGLRIRDHFTKNDAETAAAQR
jgi:hypothetical protein